MKLGFLMLTDHSEVLNGKVYAMGGGWNMLHFAVVREHEEAELHRASNAAASAGPRRGGSSPR